MSILQALIGSIVSGTSGGGGGGGGGVAVYPGPGTGSYQADFGGGRPSYGTAYDPGGAVNSVAAASAGWRRMTSEGYWCNPGSQANDNPGIFQNYISQISDGYGGFGTTAGADAFAMEWTGYFRASTAATYWNFVIDSDDVAMFWIGNSALNPTAENAYITSNNGTGYPNNSLLLTENQWYPIRMRFQEWSGAERCQVFASADGGTAYNMLTYFNAGHLLFNGASSNGYGSIGSLILDLGNATTNVYSGSGNWLDSSPALNHAVPVGNVPPTWLPDEAGGVWQLNNQYFNIPTLVNYNDPAMTMSIWFNCASDNTFSQNLISCELSYKLRVNPGGAIHIFAGNGYGWAVNASTAVTVNYGTWNNVTATVNSNETIVYLNGTVIGTYSGTTIGTAGQFPVNIGSHSSGSDLFGGKIGEVKMYSYSLTSQEVADYYAATAARYGITP